MGLNRKTIFWVWQHLTGRRRRLTHFWRTLEPKILLVDVGASYFFNQKWAQAKKIASSTFIQIDPNVDNLSYIDNEDVEAKVYKVPAALSGSGGERTLFVTNVDSGSTLFEPWISPDFAPRLGSETYSYFFPLQEKTVITQTLESVVPDEFQNVPTVLKLDVQGAELEILLHSEALLRNQVLAVEVEASLLRFPFSKNGTKLADLLIYMESLGYELVDLDLNYSHGPSTPKEFVNRGYLSECDALFVLNHREILEKSTNFKLSAFLFFPCMVNFETALNYLRVMKS